MCAALAIIALGSQPVAAQAPHTIARQAVPKSGFNKQLTAAYDPATIAYFAAMTVQPDATRKTLLSNFVRCVETHNLYTGKLDWLVLEAAQDPSQAVVNVVNPAKRLQQVGVGNFTPDRGWTGDGSSGYLSYQETLFAGGIYTQDAATLGVWYNQQGSGGGLIGQSTASGVRFQTSTAATQLFATINRGGSTVSISGSDHHLAATRTSASSTTVYTGGVPKTTIAGTSGTVTSMNGSVGLSFGVYSTARIAASYSGYLTNEDEANLHGCLSDYLAAIGAQ